MGEDDEQEPQDPMDPQAMMGAKHKAFDEIGKFARGKMAAGMKDRSAPPPANPDAAGDAAGDADGPAQQMPGMDLSPNSLDSVNAQVLQSARHSMQPKPPGKMTVTPGEPVEEGRIDPQGSLAMESHGGKFSPTQDAMKAAWMAKNKPGSTPPATPPMMAQEGGGFTDAGPSEMLKNLNPEQIASLIAMLQKAQATPGR